MTGRLIIAGAAAGSVGTARDATTAEPGGDQTADAPDGAGGAAARDDAATAPVGAPATIEGLGDVDSTASPAPAGGAVASSAALLGGHRDAVAPLGAAALLVAGTDIATGTDAAARTDAAQLAATGFDPWRLAVLGVLLLLAGGGALLHQHVAAAP